MMPRLAQWVRIAGMCTSRAREECVHGVNTARNAQMLGLVWSRKLAPHPSASTRDGRVEFRRAGGPLAGASPLPDHLPSLDGLRGIAILLVLFFHMTALAPATAADRGLRAIMGHGWVGVDLFFVLSGFLITGILLDGKGQAHYFRNFYARRTVRIFPLYYAVIAVFLIILPRWAAALSARFGHVEGRPLFYWLYLSNHALAASNGQGLDFRFGVLNPTWSLAVEEQFYLMWPLIVFLVPRKALVRRVLPAVILGVVVLRVTLIALHVPWGYLATLTPCRLDSLAIGGFVACLAREPAAFARRSGGEALLPRFAGPAALLAGLALLIIAAQSWLGFHHGELRYALGFTCIAMLAAALLIAAISLPDRHPLVWLLKRRWLMAFGKYSYALYLLHMPLQAVIDAYLYRPDRFLKVHGSAIPGQLIYYALCLSICFAAAWLSWHCFEKHFLKLKRWFPMRKASLTAAADHPGPRPTPRPAAAAAAA
jgi:peptidoglycan/LPS O-acetylase OafA/YrhL